MFRLFAILCVLLFTPAALAQNGPPAFAAVQAPEAGVGVCVQSGWMRPLPAPQQNVWMNPDLARKTVF